MARERFGNDLPLIALNELEKRFEEIHPAAVKKILGNARSDPDPHLVLADLPFSVYLTTNPDGMLSAALAAKGRPAAVAVCPWFEFEPLGGRQSAEKTDGLPTPDTKHPLVYHLFGRIAEPQSLVLTEDQYFDYMVGTVRNADKIPAAVQRAICDRQLLFLGFHIDHWTFRALLRSLTRLASGGKSANQAINHFAVQIDPEEGRFRDTPRARRYLESTFKVAGSQVRVYWGRAQDFVLELGERWRRLENP
jgi:hypothetical protein